MTADLDFIAREEERLKKAIEALKKDVERPELPKLLKLPKLLEKRRLEHLIPTRAFEGALLYDRCFVYPAADEDLQGPKTFEGTGIHMAERTKERERDANPRGVLVAAGTLARTPLASNGVFLGHMVRFQSYTPFIQHIGLIAGKQFYVHSLLAGNIVSSEDLEQQRRDGEAELVYDNTLGEYEWDMDGLKKGIPSRPKRGISE